MAERAGALKGPRCGSWKNCSKEENNSRNQSRVVPITGFRTVDQISAECDAFYRADGRIEENELMIREYSPLLLELSSFSSREEQQMREKSQQSRIQERGAGVARSESQLVIPLLETGSESNAQPRPQPQPQSQQQQQFESGENLMVLMVEACRDTQDKLDLEKRGEEQEEEHLQLPPKQQ